MTGVSESMTATVGVEGMRMRVAMNVSGVIREGMRERKGRAMHICTLYLRSLAICGYVVNSV